jgi:type I restriction enzyme, S subunit
MSQVKNIPRLRFPNYKDIWLEKPLIDLMDDFTVPMRDKPSDLSGGIPWCRIEDFEGIYLTKSKSEQGVTQETINKMNLKVYPIDTVLVSCSANLGICAIVKNPLVTNQTFIGLTPNQEVVSEYIYYIMTLSARKLNVLSSGTTISYLSRQQFEKFKIYIPETEEQQKIADFLTAVDKRIELLEKKKTLLETYKKGLMKKIFNQEIRFKDENGNSFPDWEEKKLGELSPKMKSGGTPKSTIKDYYDGDIPFLSIGDMTSQNKYLSWTSKTISKRGLENSSSWVVPKNSIIYSMYASVGFVSINKIDLSISQAVMAIQPIDEMNLEFLYYSLLNFQPKIKSLIETGTQGNINGGIVKNISIETPSLNEQIKISEFLISIDNQLELLETQIDKSKTWKKGLLQKMFV